MATVGNDRDSACLFLLTFRTKGCQRCFGTRYNYIAGADTYGTACDMDSEVRQVAKRSSTELLKTQHFLMVYSRLIDLDQCKCFVQELGKKILGRLFCCFVVHTEAIWINLDSCRLRTLQKICPAIYTI